MRANEFLNKIREGYDSRDAYEKWDPKHPDFADNYRKFKAKHPDAKIEDFINYLRGKSLKEGWESGPEERAPRERDPDWEYDQRRQEKLDAEAEKQNAKRPQTKVYTLLGRGPNMEPNYKFPGEYTSQEDAIAAREKLMADPSTPNPRMIGIHSYTKYLDETKQRLDPKCWSGYRKQGTKMKGDVRVNNCVKIKK